MIAILDKESHTYTTEAGKIIPGFSEICSRVGIKRGDFWNSVGGGEFCANETAQRFGTAFHDYALFRLSDLDCDYDPQLQPWVNFFEKYLENIGSAVCEVEKSLCSVRYGYAGTPDLFGYDGDILHVYDWKTATAMQKWKWRMQLAAYAELIQEHFGKAKKVIRHSVRFYEGGYQEDIRSGSPEDWYNFLSILNVYKMGAKG